MIVDFLPFSGIDFPEKISAVVFIKGCNLRCPYCHNPELVLKRDFREMEEEFFTFLKERKGLLEGVVFTGGEPTLSKNLPDYIFKVKEMGFCVKLDTNGTNPEMLKFLLKSNLVDYVAMDVKCKLKRYRDFLNFNGDIERIKASIEIIKSLENIRYEFRCTIGSFLSEDDLREICEMVRGCKKFVIQRYVKRDTELVKNNFKEYTAEELKEKTEFVKKYVGSVEYRFYES